MAGQRHAVFGNRLRVDEKTIAGLAGTHAGAFAVDQPAGFGAGVDRRPGGVHVVVRGERRGVATHFRFPRRDIGIERGDRAQILHCLLAGEIGRLVFGIDLHLHVHPHFRELLRGFLVVVVRGVPDDAAQRVHVFVQRQPREGTALGEGRAAQRPGVVEVVVADAQIDIQIAAAVVLAGGERAERRADDEGFLLRHFVAEEIGRFRFASLFLRPFAEHRHGAGQFQLQCLDHGVRWRCAGRGQRQAHGERTR